MNSEHTDLLHNRYSRTFYHKVNFDCGDGWFNLLDELCSKLEKLQKITGIQLNLLQIKEKFGTLRFYYTVYKPPTLTNNIDWPNIIENLVFNAQEQSGTICEHCGEPGILRVNVTWFSTLCDEHNK